MPRISLSSLRRLAACCAGIGLISGALATRASADDPQATQQVAEGVTLMPLGKAWAANAVNATIFRNDPITTHHHPHGDRQYAAYYDPQGRVIIATRTLDEAQWETTVTDLRGNVKDAHNGISIGVDSEGYLHVSWDHHNNPINYVRSTKPAPDAESLVFTDKLEMTGKNEQSVSYPQFYQLADGTLMFFYREGASGRGNLAINRYDASTQTWEQVHANLISGENERNAYWQACVGPDGALHVSWVWRETWGVETNHDLGYAVSRDGGRTWENSQGEPYDLPITLATGEVAAEIPQKHELINQTSMATDGQGNPIIATYFRPPGEEVVQYFIIRHDGEQWRTIQASDRKTPFSLSGGGTKQIPIARPQVFAKSTDDGKTGVWLVYRDVDDRNGGVSVSYTEDVTAEEPQWTTRDLTNFSVGYWEPAYDRVRWQRDGVLDLFVQNVGQGDAETLQDIPPQTAYVLEWKPTP